MKIALVTGANKGIGYETVRQLSRAGVYVFLSARDPVKAAEAAQALRADGHDVEALMLDVTDADSIERAVGVVAMEAARLDILVNNAAVKIPGDTIEAWSPTFDTNLFGMIEVTRSFLPLLKAASAARIVNVSSVSGSITPPTRFGVRSSTIQEAPAYGASKIAVNLWTIHLAHELRNTKIKVNAAHPGTVKTHMGGRDAPMRVCDGAKTSVTLALLDEEGPTGGFFHAGKQVSW
jgi:NAD(P)-dependent dehydrogenase (short-subunit alcohol dehydrogenase family)